MPIPGFWKEACFLNWHGSPMRLLHLNGQLLSSRQTPRHGTGKERPILSLVIPRMPSPVLNGSLRTIHHAHQHGYGKGACCSLSASMNLPLMPLPGHLTSNPLRHTAGTTMQLPSWNWDGTMKQSRHTTGCLQSTRNTQTRIMTKVWLSPDSGKMQKPSVLLSRLQRSTRSLPSHSLKKDWLFAGLEKIRMQSLHMTGQLPWSLPLLQHISTRGSR